jgi:hypothetical protein
MRGRVIDQDKNPVGGASVIVFSGTGEPDIYTTDQDGKFSYFDHTSPMSSETIRVSISKEGYQPIEGDEIDSRQIPTPKVNARHETEFIFTLKKLANSGQAP